MLKKKYIILLLLLILFPIQFQLFSKEKLAANVKITYIEGECVIKKKGTEEWISGKVTSVLYPGDRIRTKSESKIELKFADGSIVRLAENTELLIKTIRKDKKVKKKVVGIMVIIGNIWTYIRRAIGYAPEYEVKTPTAIVGVRGTTYRLEIGKDGETLVRVYKGEVEVKTYLEVYRRIKGRPEKDEEPKKRRKILPPKEVEGPKEVPLEEWIKIVRSMQQVIVYKDRLPEVTKFDIEEDIKLPWVKWNMERDKLINEEKE